MDPQARTSLSKPESGPPGTSELPGRAPCPAVAVSGTRPARDTLPVVLFLLVEAAFLWLTLDNADATPVLIDEFAHIPAGVSYWETGRFQLYRESPPLVRYLISFPAWLEGVRVDYSHSGMGHRSELTVGRDYLRANPDRYHDVLRGARYVNIALSLMCGALVFWWARKRHGPVAGFVCSAAWLLDPGIVAFSGAGTTDVGTACFGLVAGYTFWLFLHRPTWRWTLIAGVALGMAQASKFSMLALYPVWLAVLVAMPRCIPPGSLAPRRPPWGRSLAVLVVSVIVLNGLYLGDGTLRRLDSYTFRSRLLTGMSTSDVHAPPASNRFRGTIMGALPVPFPKDYVLGSDSQKWDEEIKLVRLSGGQLVRGGVWHGPLDTFLLKRPLGTIALVTLAIAFFLARRGRFCAADALPLVTGLALMALLGTQTGLNWADRYAFPAFPFLFLACGRAVQAAWRTGLGRCAVAACVAWNAVALACARPDYLSYANELAGGTRGAVHRFLGSNYDWGQDLARLRNFLDRNPEITPITLSYYGVLSGDAIGIESHPIPDAFLPLDTPRGTGEAKPLANQDGFYWIISANLLNGLPIDSIRSVSAIAKNASITSPLLRPEHAIARVGYSLYIFHIVPQRDSQTGPTTLCESDLVKCLRYVDRNESLITP